MDEGRRKAPHARALELISRWVNPGGLLIILIMIAELTSTRGPITAAKAAPCPSPKVAAATAIASSATKSEDGERGVTKTTILYVIDVDALPVRGQVYALYIHADIIF